MSTILFPSPVFGPVRSRRLGLSLGVNLLPADGKLCSFDCIYCECGRNAGLTPHTKMPTRLEVREALEAKLAEMAAAGTPPDAVTFAGNGEPTGHPDFEAVIEDTLALRARFCPNASVSVLTNGFHLNREGVVRALLKVDNPLLKLDTVDGDFIRRVNRPNAHYDVAEQLERFRLLGGNAVIQTMFLCGTHEGQSVDNTTDDFVLPWVEAVANLQPKLVTIYTIDRETPEKGLRKAPRESLDLIAERLRGRGLTVTVSY